MTKQQIIGSLAYWFAQNPSDMLAFYNTYNDGNQWYAQSGNPSTIHATGSYYLNQTNGDIWQVILLSVSPTWVKIGNIQSKTNNNAKNILYTDISAGISPQTTIDIPLINLGRDEVITEMNFECIIPYTSSDSATDLNISIYDTVNNIESYAISGIDNPGNNEFIALNFINEGVIGLHKNIHNTTPKTIVARFTAADLTKLNAGSCNLYFPTSFYPAP